MRFVSTGTHGALDYLVGLILIAAPLWLQVDDDAAARARWIPFILGMVLLGYSAVTCYPLGLVRKMPMYTHLWLDGGSGALLALSPWLFAFADFVWLPHVAIGVFSIAAALVSRTAAPAPRQYDDRVPVQRPAEDF